MAGKLVPLEEAAAKLGISTDELSELRQRGDIFGYRDGASWKFKPEDIDRLAEDRSDSGDSSEAVLLSEFELGASGPSTSSTVIGQMGQMQSPEDSDIQLTRQQPAGSDLKLTGSDVKLFDHKDDTVVLDGGSGQGATDDDGDLTRPPETNRGMGSSKKNLGSHLTDQPADQINLQGGSSPDADLTANPADDSSALDLAAGSDDELVLHGSGKGSDITISPGDSGISLVDPADSGISLEGPLDLNSPADSEEFELSSSEDMIGLSDSDSSDFDSDAIMEVQSDDDFLLTPLEEAGDEDSQDSGSQVIALDTEGDFADSAATIMTQSSGNLGAMLEAEEFGEAAPMGGGLGGPALAAGPVIMAGAPARDTQFSTGWVVIMGICAAMLGFSGIMMFELMRTMWGRESPTGFTSSILDSISGMLFG